MANELVTVASFLTTTEAELAQSALAEEGIASYLEGGYLVGGLSLLSNAVGGVKLQVASQDAERALAIISAAEAAAKAEYGNFFEDDEEEDEADAAEFATATGDAMAARAFRVAVLGILCCPPLLHFYSAWLLIRIGLSDAPLSPSGTRKFYAALVIDLLVGSLAGFFYSILLR